MTRGGGNHPHPNPSPSMGKGTLICCFPLRWGKGMFEIGLYEEEVEAILCSSSVAMRVQDAGSIY